MAEKKENLTPEQRLQEALVPCTEWPYKLPENWCWTYINNICNLKNISSLQMGIYPYLEAKYLRGKIKPEYKNSGKFIKKDSKVILVDGENSGEVFTINEDGYMGSTFRLLSISSIIDNTYFEYYISLQREAFRSSKTGSAIPHLNKELFRTLPFPIAPLNEQQRIVDQIENLFSRLDEAKEKTQAALDSFESRKAAILHKAFTGELTAKWRKNNNVKIENWKTLPLKRICKVNPPKINTKELSDELDVSFYPMASLSEIYGAIVDPQIKKLKEVRTGYTNFSEGDVVFAKITPCMENGKSAIIGKLINNIGFGTTEFYVLRCASDLYNKYLYHLVRSQTFRDEAKSVMTGAVGQQRVPKSFIENYEIHLPLKDEQIEIVRIIDNLFVKEQQAKEAAETVLEQIELIKKSILSRAFRGELGTNDPNEESSVELLKEILAKKE